MSRQDFEKLAEKLRNWGRWGAEDQRGTLNFITPGVLKAAAATVTAGKAFSLGLRFDKSGPQLSAAAEKGPQLGVVRFNPLRYVTGLFIPLNAHHPDAVWSDDVVHMPPQAATQWDALGHVHYSGTLYNGHKACDTLSPEGASHLGIEHLATPGIVSRGVLLDVARLKGVDILPPDYLITVDDLNAACRRQNVEVEPGDIVAVRTGHMRHFTVNQDRRTFNSFQSGLSHHCAEWLHDKSVAAATADNLAVEAIPLDMSTSQEMPFRFHMLCLRDMGCPLGEMFDLEALAADCAADGRYQFLLSAPPLGFTGGFGSPVNPIALK